MTSLPRYYDVTTHYYDVSRRPKKKKLPGYLWTQLQVDHDDGDLSTRDNQNHKDHEEEPEEVVDLIFPNRSEDKKQFNKDSPEGEDAGQKHTGDGERFLIRAISG